MNALPLTAGSTRFGLAAEIGIGVALLLIGVAIGASVMRLRIGRPAAVSGDHLAAPPPDYHAGSQEKVRTDDAALARSLIELADQAHGSGWQSKVTAAMSACGIVADYPLGEEFDASRHHVVDTDTTTDPAQDMRICEVERPGYRQTGTSIRAADVVVLRYQPDRPGGGGGTR